MKHSLCWTWRSSASGQDWKTLSLAWTEPQGSLHCYASNGEVDAGHPFLCVTAGALWDPAWHLLCSHICVPCTQCIGFPGYRSHNYRNPLRPTQVSMLLGCQSGPNLMRIETPPHTLRCVCIPKVEGAGLHTSEMERHLDNISAHMTIQLPASGQVYSVPEPESKHQLLQSPCGL